MKQLTCEMCGSTDFIKRDGVFVCRIIVATSVFVGNYSPDWAIAFYEGTVKHIFFVAETKGSMSSMELTPY